MSKRKEEIEPVEISQEENGYYVIMGSDCDRENQERYVFQTFEELKDFLSDHFTHRKARIELDVFSS
jgi:hypothetical protein